MKRAMHGRLMPRTLLRVLLAVSAAPLASAAPGAASPQSPKTVVTRELVRELPCDARFFPIGGRTFVACDRRLFAVEGGALVDDAVHARGLNLGTTGWWTPRIVRIAGQWPSSAWAATHEPSGGGNSIDLRFFRWQKDRWVAVSRGIQIGGPIDWVAFPWGQDGLAALAPDAFVATRVFAFSAQRTPMPLLTKAIQTKQEANDYRCVNAMIAPEAWAELAPHDVMVFAGQLCGVPGSERSFGVERLRAGQNSGELRLFPLPAEIPGEMLWHEVVAAALGPTDALVAASGAEERRDSQGPRRQFQYVARWDGVEWRPEPAPLGMVTALWAESGAYFATDADGALWLRRGGRWSVVAWNETKPRSDAAAIWKKGEIAQLESDGAGTLWLVLADEAPHGSYVSRLYRLRFEP